MLNYEEVPNNILTGKDLDYLSDMFSWNYGALKSVNSSVESVSDMEIKSILEKGYNLFNSNLENVLNILESRGNNE